MTDTGVTSGAPHVPKLPVFRTVGQAYGAFITNFGTLIRVAWFWVLLMLAFRALQSWLLPSWMTSPVEIMPLDRPSLLLVSVLGFLIHLIILPIFASIAVTWHRLLLLGEKPAAAAFRRLDHVVWSYVALAAAIALLQFLTSLPQVLLTRRGTGGMEIFTLFASLVTLAFALFVPRLSLSLPARAIGDGGAGMGNSMVITRGNTWRLAWGGLLCFMPAILMGLFTFLVWPGQQVMMTGRPPSTVVQSVSSALWPLLGVVFVGYLSFAYAHFSPGKARAV